MEPKEQRTQMVEENITSKVKSERMAVKKTLGSIVSFTGGFGLGFMGKEMFGREYMTMINDLKYSKGLGYILPGLFGALQTRIFGGNVPRVLLNISAAEIGYLLGCNFGKRDF